MATKIYLLLAFLLGIAYAQKWNSSPNCPKYGGKIIRHTSKDSAGLRKTIDAYRELLGGKDNGSNGPKKSGHRSINWDADVVPFKMPFDFFRDTVPRGAEFSTKDNYFVVSNPAKGDHTAPAHGDNRFSSIHKDFPHIFTTFSPKRLFSGFKSNIVGVHFSVPKRPHVKATVSGFGAVFTNVVLEHTTSIAYFDKDDCPIITVPADPFAKGLSFVGIKVELKNGKKQDLPSTQPV